MEQGTLVDYFSFGQQAGEMHGIQPRTCCPQSDSQSYYTIITTAADVAALTYLFNLLIQFIYLAYLYICIYIFYAVIACC